MTPDQSNVPRTRELGGSDAVKGAGEMPGDGRTVMRHQIALRLDDFRAAPDEFRLRPQSDAPPLHPSQRPFFSIVIPNYNGAGVLPPLLAALDSQTFTDFEIIVVDDASADTSVLWIEQHYPDVRIIVNRQNLGFAVSCNVGGAAAHGRVLVLLNSDTEPEPEWAAALASAVCGRPDASMFASKVLLRDQEGVLHTTGDMMRRSGIPVNRGVWETDLGQYDEQPEVFGASGCAAAIHHELWTELGGFDEDLWMYMEDVDFAFRARLMGARGVFVPGARVRHRLTATAGGTLSSYYVGRNTIWAIAKNMPGPLLTKYWGRIAGAQLRLAFDALRNIRGAEARARLRGQLTGLMTLRHRLRKRRVVQERRRVASAALDRQLYG